MNTTTTNFDFQNCEKMAPDLDPYKRDAWFDNDKEWNDHLASLPPLKKEKIRKTRRDNKSVQIKPDHSKRENSKMCKSILLNKKCKYRNCNFAHTIEELSPNECKFKKNCRYKHKCKFIHEDETKLEYINRVYE